MAYEIEEIKASQEIFYYLLEYHELREAEEIHLFKAYTQNEKIQNLVKSQGTAAQCEIERYGNVVYLIPKEENNYLGFSKAQLKSILCKSGATDKDYYLAQFVILTILVEFFDGQGSSAKTREYIRVGELQNVITKHLKEGVENARQEKEKKDEKEEEKAESDMEQTFLNMLETYEALRSDDKGSRAKTTKEGFLYHILLFLQKQGLIDYVEADEMVKTTKKLDNFMDWNLLNRNNYNRVCRMIGATEDE